MTRDDDERLRRTLERRSAVASRLAAAPARKPALVDALDSSRSTVDRAIDELAAVGCVRREDSEYALTTTGRLALRTYEGYRSATDAIAATTEFVNCLPADAPLDTSLLDGASVSMSSEHVPDQALAPSTDLFKRATRMRGLAPVVLGFYPNTVAEQLSRDELTVEIVASAEVLGALPSIPDVGTASLSEADGLSLYESGGELPYALWLMETPESDYAGITAYDAGGAAGVLMNDSPAAVEWAESEYERYRADASEANPFRS
ncbi:helix-turn-helix transcriptional regulator [Halogeometricum luteum]|uniref:Transcriptional regulator n=1 Tax=Halogeometricum luteum TaxID=2950537 RepID=A0ABU2FZ90_9EURY|nr:hypothetical protein [Halogeometricum sp. S3BR5-2]MDS0293541.1 hypothetical protein [Halogeometricum sp. S3BR5-2]